MRTPACCRRPTAWPGRPESPTSNGGSSMPRTCRRPGHVPAGHLRAVLPLDGPARWPGGARHAHAGRRLRPRARHHPPRDRDRRRAAVAVAAVSGAGRAEPPLPRSAARPRRGPGRTGSPRSTAPRGSAGRPRSPSRGRSSPGPSRRSSPLSPCRARLRTCSATGWPGSSTRLAPCCTQRAPRGVQRTAARGGRRHLVEVGRDYAEARLTRRPVRPATPGRPAERDRPGDGAPLTVDRYQDRELPTSTEADVTAAAERARAAQTGGPRGRWRSGATCCSPSTTRCWTAGMRWSTWSSPGRQGPAQRHRGGAARRADRPLLRPDRSALPARRAWLGHRPDAHPDRPELRAQGPGGGDRRRGTTR